MSKGRADAGYRARGIARADRTLRLKPRPRTGKARTMKRKAGQDPSITARWRPATLAVRGGTARSEYGETSEALFLTSGYTYDRAEDAAARFAGEQEGMTYSRLQNPTVEMLEQRIALLEGAEACRTMATGMAAMTAALLCQLETGDHIVAGRAAFGSCRWLTDTLLPKFGIGATIVDARDPQQFLDAVRAETKLFFFETPANPTMDVVDLRAVCAIARERGIKTVVDNAFATPALQRPMEYGADITAYSATKMMDGQGRVLAGAVCGTKDFIDNTLLPFTRNTGPTLSPFNAWVVLKGLETLDLRIRRQSESAVTVGTFLEGRVPTILHPGLPSHPQHDLAMSQMDACGPIFAFEVADRAQAHGLLNALALIDISNNIGDSRSLMTHPASTTHSGLAEDKRREMGVTEGMIRINVGLEDPRDLIDDLDQALRTVGL